MSGRYEFVGRARRVEGVRERRVRLLDGQVTWAEEGSMVWEWAERGLTAAQAEAQLPAMPKMRRQ